MLGGYTTDQESIPTESTTAGTGHNTVVIIATSATASFVLCGGIMLCVLMTVTCRCYRRRKQRHYHQLNNQENDEITNHDPVQVGPRDGAESVYSDGTDLTRLQSYGVQRFLADQTVVVADVEEDQQSLDDDFSHTDKGMEEEEEEEMERESLQGSGELETQSGTGSLQEQQKLRLNRIRKENTRKTSEAIELSSIHAVPSPKTTPPLSVRSTTLSIGQHSPSLVAHFPKGYQKEARLNGYLQETSPPTGDQGGASHNGYLPHTRTEAFHNPVCTTVAPVAGGAAGGKTPPMPTHQTSSTNGNAALRSHMTQGPPSLGPLQREAVAVIMGRASSTATQSAVDKGQSAAGSNSSRSKLELANNGFTNSGYVQSPFGDDFVPSTSGSVHHHPTPASGHVHNSRSSTPSSGGNIHHPPVSSASGYVHNPSTSGNIHNPPASGYVQDPSALSSSGNIRHPPVPSATGCIDNLPTSVDPRDRDRDSRSRSAESGNEDDSTSNEGDAISVFGDDVMPSFPDHVGRSRSTLTSGFQSGSSESASPEPPIKSLSNSPPPSPPTLSHHSHTQGTGTRFPISSKLMPDLSTSGSMYPFSTSGNPCTLNSSSYSSDSHFPLPSHTYNSSQTSSFGIYRPSSDGGSSGYVTNSSYHDSSAVSQTSKGTTDDLEREFPELEAKNFIPSLFGTSNSSSPLLPHANISQSSTDVSPPSRNTLPLAEGRHFPLHYDAHPTTPATIDYYNTKDIDLSTISFDPRTEGESDKVHSAISFEFPVSSS